MSSDLTAAELLDNFNHHAFLVVGDFGQYEKLRLGLHRKTAAGELESSDIWHQVFESVGIDDARAIKDLVSTRPNGPRRVVLISLVTIQHEAQNSLLKLFEDPAADTTFFICARTTEIFLPTLLSRFNVIDLGRAGVSAAAPATAMVGTQAATANLVAKKFLAGTIKARLALLEPIIKEKDKARAESFLDGLEAALHQAPGFLRTENAPVFETIFAARRFLRGRSPSVKMILEQIACSIPPKFS